MPQTMIAAAAALPAGLLSAFLARRCTAVSARARLGMIALQLAVALSAATAARTAAMLIAGLVLGWGLALLAWIDGRTMRLPDALTFPLIVLGLGWTGLARPHALGDHVCAALLAYAAFRGLALAFRRLRGREGLGLGDAKLFAVAGAWLGLAALPAIALIASALALAVAGVRVLARGRASLSAPIPFGPPLCAATWLFWLGAAAPP
jgi:leader peptidase (prepilin peptidase)/N-methyltransferase